VKLLEPLCDEEREGKQVGHAGKPDDPRRLADVIERRVEVEGVRAGPDPGKHLVIDEVDGNPFLLEHRRQVEQPQRGCAS